MYGDHPPVPNCPTEKVLVLDFDDGDNLLDEDEVIAGARDESATTTGGEGETFWVVFADEPRRLWDFTEQTLREEIRRRKREVVVA